MSVARLAIAHGSGLPVLRLDEKPLPALMQDVTAVTTDAEWKEVAASGIMLVRLRGLDLGWTGPNQFDYAALNERMERLAAAHPGAACWLVLTVDAPRWWRIAHPEEGAAFCLPETEASAPVVSWASKRWQNEAGQALARLLRHIGTQAWGAQVVGIQLAAGEEGSWRHPEAERMPDIGPRMTERFQQWVRDRYRGNAGLLKKAWDDPRADIARLRCPGQKEREHADRGIFRSATRSRRLLDYYECFYGAQTDAILHFAGVVKKTTEGRLLVGVAFGQFLDQEAVAEGGYAFPDAVFDSAEIDVFFDANPRGRFTISAGSLALRQKFLFHLPAAQTDLFMAAARTLTHSAGLLLPSGVAPSARDALMKLFTQQEKSGAAARKRNTQFCVIVDPAAALLTSSLQTWANRLLLNEQIEELAKVGAPFDVYLLSDLFHPKFRDHKVTLFLNTFYFTEAERRRIDGRVKRSGQTTVWLWAAGINAEEGLSGENITKATGVKTRLEPTETSLKTRIVEANDPLTWGAHIGSSVGAERAIGPTLTITDKSITRLGANSDNKTVFGVKRSEKWNGVLFGTFPVPARLLRNVLRAAGCHLWTEGEEAITADGRLVAVLSEKGGSVKLSLPGIHEIHDALSGARLGAEDDLTLTLKPNEPRLLATRPLKKGNHNNERMAASGGG